MTTRIFTTIGLFLILLDPTGPAMAADCLPYEPAVVTITGNTEAEFGYGPPGFGEDPAQDAKEQYVLLTLDHPICVSGGESGSMDEDVSRIQSIQLVFGIHQHYDPQLLGQRVSVSGQLFHRISGGHTDVMIEVATVQKAL